MEEARQSTRKYYKNHPHQELYTIPAQNLYNLPTSPEFLFHEESTHQRRSWSENLQYCTGLSYLSAALLGSCKGSLDGILSAERGDSAKLRLNRVLNSGGQLGRKWGNNSGVVGLIYSGLESSLIGYRDVDDWGNTVVAGLGTGAIYKAAKGPRSAAIAGAIGGIAAGLAVVGKQAVKRYVPI